MHNAGRRKPPTLYSQFSTRSLIDSVCDASGNQVPPDADLTRDRCPVVDEYLNVRAHDGEPRHVAADIVWATVPRAVAGNLDEIGALRPWDVFFEIDIATRAHRAFCVKREDDAKVYRWLDSVLLTEPNEDVDMPVANDLRVRRNTDADVGSNRTVGYEFNYFSAGRCAGFRLCSDWLLRCHDISPKELSNRLHSPVVLPGSPAVLGPSGSRWWLLGGSEDPWLCVPSFGWVCLSQPANNHIWSRNVNYGMYLELPPDNQNPRSRP